MKSIDLENLILITLRRAGWVNGSEGMTLTTIQQAITPAQGGGPGWRVVANATHRLERQGFVKIVGDEQTGDNCQPLYALTRIGIAEAQNAASLDPGLVNRKFTQEATDASS